MFLFRENAQYRLKFISKVHLKIYCKAKKKKQFSDLPEKWITLRKTAVNVKYKIVSIQTYQVNMIYKRISHFNQQIQHFREKFQKIEV